MALKDEYYTISEAAEQVGVTRQTISRWINEGKLLAEKIGRETLIKIEQVNQLIDERLTVLIGKYVDRRLGTFLKEKYNYTKGDIIEPLGTKRKPFAIGYSVRRKDGNREKVWIHIGKVEFSEDEPLLNLEIKKLTRTVEPKKKGK